MKRFLLLLVVLLSPGVSADEILQLNFQVMRGEAGTPQALTVYLGKDWLEFQDDQRWVRHDFAEKRSYSAEELGVREFSLFANIGFRMAQLQDHIRIQQALKKAGVDSSQFQAQSVQIEHLFSLEAPQAADPVYQNREGTAYWSYQDKPLLQYSLGGEPLEPGPAAEFVRFLRYYTGGHPDALLALERELMVPSKLLITQYHDDETTTWSLQLQRVDRVESPPEFPKLGAEPDNELGRLLQTVDSLSPEEIRQRHQQTLGQAREAREEGRWLVSALRYSEATLNDGSPMSAELGENRETFLENPEAAAFFDSLTLRTTPEQLTDALNTLQNLKSKAGEAEYVLTLYQGSLLLGANQAEQAGPRLFEALKASPVISGAWKDLGDAFYSSYEINEAWQCWDAGRKIAPNNPYFGQVNKLEQLLMATYPGFF